MNWISPSRHASQLCHDHRKLSFALSLSLFCLTSTFESELRNSRCGKFEFHPSSCNFGQSFLPLPTVLPSAFQNSEVRSLSTTNRGRVENGERAKRRMRERNGFSIQARVIGSWRSANAESAEETVPHTLNSKPRLLESKRQTKRLTLDKEADPNFLIQFANFYAPDHGSAIPIDRPFSGSYRFYIRWACACIVRHEEQDFPNCDTNDFQSEKRAYWFRESTRERQKEKGQSATTMANKIYV